MLLHHHCALDCWEMMLLAELGAQLRVQRADESLDGRARQSRQLEIVRGGLVRARAVAPLLLLEISLRDLVMS